MTERVFEIEHHPDGETIFRFKAPGISVMPEATRSHLRAAHKEILLALRSLLDMAIQRAEEAEKPKTKERTKIEVQ